MPNKQTGYAPTAILLALLAAVIIALAGWYVWDRRDSGEDTNQPPAASSHGGPVKDYVSLVDNLRGAGATVDPSGENQGAFFETANYQIMVNGAPVDVYEFADSAGADKAAATVSSDGTSINKSELKLSGSPHYYKNAKLIVVYIGEDKTALNSLSKVLGEQFAGSSYASQQ